MNIKEEFPSKYLKSADLGGKVAKLTIAHVDSEEIGKDRKLVLYFKGKDRGMVLNKTNAQTIAEQFGDETDNWTGGLIEVFSMKVDYQGQRVDGLRIRIPEQPRPNNGRAAPVRSGGVDFVANARDDDRVRRNLPDDRVGAPQAPPPLDEDVGDEVPF